MELKEVIELGTFTEKRKTGEEITFIVQTAPSEMAQEIVEFMTNFFIPYEPISKCKILDDTVSTKSAQEGWAYIILKGTSVIALEISDDGTKKLIGANVTPISVKDHNEKMALPGENFNDACMAMQDVANRANIYEKYNVDRYLKGFGLCVDPHYQGFNVGLRILQCRIPLCKKLDIKATATIFTGPTSQHIAKKCGFELLGEYEYLTYTLNGEKPFEDVPGKMQIMGMLIE